VRYQKIGDEEFRQGTITRTFDDSDRLGYEYDFGVIKGFFADHSTDNVGENAECFKFVSASKSSEKLSLIGSFFVLPSPIGGKTRELKVTHETDNLVLFNGSISGSLVFFDAFCSVENGYIDPDEIVHVGENILVKSTVKSKHRRVYLATIEASMNSETGNIERIMGGIHKRGHVTMSEFLQLSCISGVDKENIATMAQHTSAYSAICARTKSFPTTADSMGQRRVTLSTLADKRAKEELLAKANNSKTPRKKAADGKNKTFPEVITVADDEVASGKTLENTSPDGKPATASLPCDIDSLISINKRSARQIKKLSQHVVRKAAQVLDLDENGSITSVLQLRDALIEHFNPTQETHSDWDDNSFGFQSYRGDDSFEQVHDGDEILSMQPSDEMHKTKQGSHVNSTSIRVISAKKPLISESPSNQ